MKLGNAVGKCVKPVFNWIARRWESLVAPNETRQQLRVSNLNRLVQVYGDLQRSSNEYIKERIQVYRDIGISDETIREKIEDLIDKGNDPMARIAGLIEKGVLLELEEDKGWK